jgi:hypothetical protein
MLKSLTAPLQSLLDLWRHPTDDQIAERELAQAKRDFLHHKDGEEFHRAMCRYLVEKINRLQARNGGIASLDEDLSAYKRGPRPV